MMRYPPPLTVRVFTAMPPIGAALLLVEYVIALSTPSSLMRALAVLIMGTVAVCLGLLAFIDWLRSVVLPELNLEGHRLSRGWLGVAVD